MSKTYQQLEDARKVYRDLGEIWVYNAGDTMTEATMLALDNALSGVAGLIDALEKAHLAETEKFFAATRKAV